MITVILEVKTMESVYLFEVFQPWKQVWMTPGGVEGLHQGRQNSFSHIAWEVHLHTEQYSRASLTCEWAIQGHDVWGKVMRVCGSHSSFCLHGENPTLSDINQEQNSYIALGIPKRLDGLRTDDLIHF